MPKFFLSSPFDKVRYERLLKGLEAIEVPKSKLLARNPTIRIDSEYWQHLYIGNDARLRALPTTVEFQQLNPDITGGATPLGAEYLSSGVGFLRVQNVMQNYIDDGDMVFITSNDDAAIARSRLAEGDVLLTITGVSYGKSAVVTSKFSGYNINQHSVRIRFSDGSIRPKYLSTFLNSCFGKLQSDRNITGVTRPALDYEAIRRFLIPVLSQQTQDAVDTIVSSAHVQQDTAKAMLGQASILVLRNIGLESWQPPTDREYTAKASQAFAAGRLDAEYYHPRYQALLAVLKKKGDFRLGDRVIEPIQRGIGPEYIDNGDMLVINSQHVGTTHVDLETNRRTTSAWLKANGGNKARVRPGDVLLNSTGYITIGRSQCLMEKVNAVVDNHVAIIRPQVGIDPVYLAVFLNSMPGLWQTERGWTGSSGQIELRRDVVADYRIWDAPSEVQQDIRRKVEAAYAAHKQAKALLDAAKLAVEIAIEQSEDAAMYYLKSADPWLVPCHRKASMNDER